MSKKYYVIPQKCECGKWREYDEDYDITICPDDCQGSNDALYEIKETIRFRKEEKTDDGSTRYTTTKQLSQEQINYWDRILTQKAKVSYDVYTNKFTWSYDD